MELIPTKYWSWDRVSIILTSTRHMYQQIHSLLSRKHFSDVLYTWLNCIFSGLNVCAKLWSRSLGVNFLMDIQFVTDSQTMDLFPVLLWHVISNNTSYISSLNCCFYFLFRKVISKFEDEQRIRDAWSSKRISFKQSSAAKGETGIIIVCFSLFCFTPLACRRT